MQQQRRREMRLNSENSRIIRANNAKGWVGTVVKQELDPGPAVGIWAGQWHEWWTCFEHWPIVIRCRRDTWTINQFNGCWESLLGVMPLGPRDSVPPPPPLLLLTVMVDKRRRRRMWRPITTVEHAMLVSTRHPSVIPGTVWRNYVYTWLQYAEYTSRSSLKLF